MTLFLAGAKIRRLPEKNAWKEQGGWEKSNVHAWLVGGEVKGHRRDGIRKIQKCLVIPENQRRKCEASQHASKSQAVTMPDTNSVGSPEYRISSKDFIGEK